MGFDKLSPNGWVDRRSASLRLGRRIRFHVTQLRALLALRMPPATTSEPPKPFLFLADLPPAPLVGFGLARRRGVDTGAHHLHRQSDDVDRGAGEAARKAEGENRKKNQAHGFALTLRPCQRLNIA